MALTLFPLFALTTPPPTVALSDGPGIRVDGPARRPVLGGVDRLARRMPRPDAATLGAGACPRRVRALHALDRHRLDRMSFTGRS